MYADRAQQRTWTRSGLDHRRTEQAGARRRHSIREYSGWGKVGHREAERAQLKSLRAQVRTNRARRKACVSRCRRCIALGTHEHECVKADLRLGLERLLQSHVSSSATGAATPVSAAAALALVVGRCGCASTQRCSDENRRRVQSERSARLRRLSAPRKSRTNCFYCSYWQCSDPTLLVDLNLSVGSYGSP